GFRTASSGSRGTTNPTATTAPQWSRSRASSSTLSGPSRRTAGRPRRTAGRARRTAGRQRERRRCPPHRRALRPSRGGPMTARLSRNRNYQLLWGGQALSEFGLSTATIAFPLLVLAATGSPAASGLVLGTAATASLLAGLPAGAIVDR